MNPVTLIWSLSAGVSLTLAAMHLLVWVKDRTAVAHLAFAIAGLAVTGVAAGEMQMMAADNPADFARVLRWIHVPVAVLFAAIVRFVGLYFRTGRAWLARVAIGIRLVAVAVDFAVPVNLNYCEITELGRVDFLGQPVSLVTAGVMNPWGLLGPVSSLLLVGFVADASVRLWRKGGAHHRRKALVIGGGIVVSVFVATGHSFLIHERLIESPYLISLCFLGFLAGMAHELANDVIRAARLSTELQESQQRMSLVVESAPNALIMVDASARMVLVNRQAEITFGYPREELIGHPIEMLIPQRFSEGHHSLQRGFLASPEKRAMGAGRDLYGRRKDGAEVPVEVGLNPIHTSEGRFVLASVIDITERRRAEQVAHEQQTELTHLSRVSSLGQLSGSLAHELNQPLGIILSNAQAAIRMLDQGTPDLAEIREILADIAGEGRRAGEVITRLRALLKRGETRLLPVSLNAIVEDVLRLTRSDLVGRGVTVRTVLSDGLPDINGDQVQLQQVLLNLILNACDAMAMNPLRDRVLRISTSPGAGTIRVSLCDQGCGLPAGDASRIFQPFVTTKSHGLGIGLSICRSIIEAHRGRLWAEPNAGPGTTFHIELSIAEPVT